MDARVVPLPAEVISRLRADTIITGIAAVASELAANSIDAGATKICILLDTASCSVRVADNGCGIPRDALSTVCLRHGMASASLQTVHVVLNMLQLTTSSTSKLHSLKDFEAGVATLGFRGEALASLAEVSVLDITTKYKSTAGTYRKVVKTGKVVSFGLCSERRATGTTVTVRDFFFNQPVRRRLLQANARKELDGVRKEITQLALGHPDISFRINEARRLFNIAREATCGNRICNNGPVWKRSQQSFPAFAINVTCPLNSYDVSMDPTKTAIEFKDWDSILDVFSHALLQAWASFLPASFLKGINYNQAAAQVQSSEHVATPAHTQRPEAYSKQAAQKRKHNSAAQCPPSPRDPPSKPAPVHSDEASSKPERRVKRHAVHPSCNASPRVAQLDDLVEVRRSDADNAAELDLELALGCDRDDDEQAWAELMQMVKPEEADIPASHRPVTTRSKEVSQGSISSCRRRLDYQSPGRGVDACKKRRLSHRQAGCAPELNSLCYGVTMPSQENNAACNMSDGAGTAPDLDTACKKRQRSSGKSAPSKPHNELPHCPPRSEEAARKDEQDKTDRCDTKWRRGKSPLKPTSRLPSVPEMYKAWKNPCMRIQEKHILELRAEANKDCTWTAVPSSINRDMLSSARVLQQVEEKFIAAVAHGVLVIIDQHAADERVRLEELRKEVLDPILQAGAAPPSLQLKQPAVLSTSSEEEHLLQVYRKQLERWGWRWKCRGRETQLHAVVDIAGTGLTPADFKEHLRELKETQGALTAPHAVARTLNSKACRSAIMFGDLLLQRECAVLVDRLRRTQLCLQCAHGRPTLVPIVKLQALHQRYGVTLKAALHCTRASGQKSTATPRVSLERLRARLAVAKDMNTMMQQPSG
eukprot:jgi/Chlat1/6269/Chrsp44S05861